MAWILQTFTVDKGIFMGNILQGILFIQKIQTSIHKKQYLGGDVMIHYKKIKKEVKFS